MAEKNRESTGAGILTPPSWPTKKDREKVECLLFLLLVEALSHESRWVGLQAANALDRIGGKARPAIDAIRTATADSSQENLFIRWVMAHTLERLLQEDDKGND